MKVKSYAIDWSISIPFHTFCSKLNIHWTVEWLMKYNCQVPSQYLARSGSSQFQPIPEHIYFLLCQFVPITFSELSLNHISVPSRSLPIQLLSRTHFISLPVPLQMNPDTISCIWKLVFYKVYLAFHCHLKHIGLLGRVWASFTNSDFSRFVWSPNSSWISILEVSSIDHFTW